MHIMIANMQTGEVIEFRSDLGVNSQGLKTIRGHIRQWMNNGLLMSDFNVIKYSDYHLWQYVREYAYQKVLVTCDMCDSKQPAETMNFVEDTYEVCLAIVCNQCNGGK